MLRWIRRRCRPADSEEKTIISPGQQAASAAFQRARSDRREVEGLGPQVMAAAATLRRERDYLREAVEATFRGGA
jgi:hypothetical protein